jgi:hypothetical protein
MRRWLGLLVAVLPWVMSCGEDETQCIDCPQAPEFVFRIAVRDAAGRPVPGLRVSLQYPPFAARATRDRRSHSSALPATLVHFEAPDTTVVTLDVIDLARRVVAQPLSLYRTLPGLHAIALAPDAPYGAYWCRLVARDDSAVVFRDSVLAGWWPLTPESNVLGVTDAYGGLETHDALRFPNVLELPPLAHMNEQGDSLGVWSYPDTVVVVLAGPPGGPFGQVSSNRLVVGPGLNEFELAWPGTPAPAGSAGQAETAPAPAGAAPGVVTARAPNVPAIPGPLGRWRLYQNSPNPAF